MSYNANTEGWLTVKGDRLCQALQNGIEYAENENFTITSKELAELLKDLKRHIGKVMHKKTLEAEKCCYGAPSVRE